MIPARSPGASWQVVDGETVLMQVEAGELCGLNAVGARVWDLIDGARSIDEIAAVIAAEFRVEPARAADDVRAFIDALAAGHFIDLS